MRFYLPIILILAGCSNSYRVRSAHNIFYKCEFVERLHWFEPPHEILIATCDTSKECLDVCKLEKEKHPDDR